MAYQVLARKYRPQKFCEVLGQEHITRTLQNAIDAGRLHHAYLFTGVRGVGKTTVARILAKALNCESASSTEPCNECKNCTEITNGSHLDVQEIDGASNTGVDDVREIREQIKYLPSQGKYKIYIIDEVHMLSTAAFNALLKTLEEPPSHVIFVFATTEPQKIPTTILSRCQRYDFRRIVLKVITDSLREVAIAEKVDIEPDALLSIASEAEGSMRDAQSLFDQAVAFSNGAVTYSALKDMLGFMDRAQVKSFLKAVTAKDAKIALEKISEIFEQGGNLIRFSEELLTWFRLFLIFSATGDQAFLKDVPNEDKEFIAVTSKNLDLTQWQQLFNICYKQVEEISRSKYPKMLLESLAIQLANVRPVKSVDTLIAQVDQILAKSSSSPTKSVQTNKVELQIESKIPNPIASTNVDEKEWKKFIEYLASQKPQLSSIIEHGVFAGAKDRIVLLEYSAESIYGDMLKEAHRVTQLEEYVKEYFKKPYAVKLNFQEAETSIHEKNRMKIQEKKDRSKQIKEETLSHEAVKEAALVLGADIQEIRVKTD